MATNMITVRLEQELLDEIGKQVGVRGRNRWIVQAIRQALKRDEVPAELSTQQQIERADTEQQLDLLLDKHLVSALQGENPLGSLTQSELAKLAAQRAPKASNSSEQIQNDVMSLTECLKLLPDAEDIVKDLSHTKYKLLKLQSECEISKAINKATMSKLKKLDLEAWQHFTRAVEIMSERCNALAKESEARVIEYSDLRALL